MPHPDHASATPALRIRGLAHHYGMKSVLRDLDFEVAEGSFVLLVGRNGAGKTTLLRLLAGLLRPSRGTIDVFGLDPLREGARVRAALGWVPEDRAWPFPAMSVQAFLRYHAAYRPTWDPSWEESLVEALELPLHRTLRGLSKGEFRRAQIAAALAPRPPLIVLDEPTDGLDPVFRERFHELLADHLAQFPATVLASTHIPRELEGFADTLAVLRGGRLDPVLPRERLQDEGRSLHLSVPKGWAPPQLDSGVLLRRAPAGREELWLTLAPEEELRARIEASGAGIRELRPLRLEEAAVALLEEGTR